MPTDGLGQLQGPGNHPRPEALIKIIRFIAAESSHVIITRHAEERMDERGITSKMLFDALRKGEIYGEIEQAISPDEYKVKITYQVPSMRYIGAVTVVKQAQKLIVVTVEWEDGR